MVRRAMHILNFIIVLARWSGPTQAMAVETATFGVVVVELKGDFASAIVVALNLDQQEGFVLGRKA